MRKALCTLFHLLLLALTAHAFDVGSSRGYGAGGNTVLSHSNPTDLLCSPTGGLSAGEWRIETGFTRTFDLEDLDQEFVAFAGRYQSLTLATGFSQFGRRDLYSERTAKAGLVWQIDSLSFGVTGSYFNTSFGGLYSALHAYSIGTGISWRTRLLLVAVAGDNLNRPTLYTGAVAYEPVYSGQIELRSSAKLSTLGRILLQKMERPRFSLGQRFGLGRAGAVTWGLITAPIMFGGGVELGVGHAAVTYGASYHPVLGLSQTISVSVGSRAAKKGNGGDEFHR